MSSFEIGKTYSYKEICKIKNEKPVTGNSKPSQIRIWNQTEIWEKNSTKYKFLGRRTPDEIEYNILHPYKYSIDLTQFKVPPKLHNSPGIYKLQLDNRIYIGETNNFRHRYSQYYNHKSTHSCNEDVVNLFKQGALFEMIEVENNAELRLSKEKGYIKKYSSDPNYTCLNRVGNSGFKIRRPRYYTVKNSKKKLNPIYVQEEYLALVIAFLEENQINYRLPKSQIKN